MVVCARQASEGVSVSESRWSGDGRRCAVLDEVVREGLSDEVTFEQSPAGQCGSHEVI